VSRRRYTDQQFRDAIADPTVRTIADLCRRLGILPRGADYDTVRSIARRLQVELPAPASSVRGPGDERRGTDPLPCRGYARACWNGIQRELKIPGA
jgi:hypothetical protein